MNTSMQNQGIDPAALRLYYLQQLGVHVYVGREAIVTADAAFTNDAAFAAGAVVTTDESPHGNPHESPLAEAAQRPITPSVTTAPEVAVVATVARKSLLNEVEDVAASAPASVAAKPAALASASAGGAMEESAAMAPFQLLFFMPEPRLAVALQIPALSKPVLQDAEARLLQNLLRWLGIKNSDSQTALLHFRWPLPSMPAGDAKAAGRNLQVFLEQAAATQPWQHLLLLGQGPAHCLDTAAGELPFQCWATHSLAEMLAVPELKREVWRHLLSLHDQL